MTPLRQRTLSALLIAALALCAFGAHAEEGPDASVETPSWLAQRKPSKPAKAIGAGPSVGLGRSLGVLLLTALLGGAALYLRQKKNQAPSAKLAHLRVVASTKLGARAQLVLAEVDGRKILLGVTDSSVRKLGWMEEAAVVEDEYAAARPRLVAAGTDLSERAARADAAAPSPAIPQSKRSFRDLLANAVSNLGHPVDDSAAVTLAAQTEDTFTLQSSRRQDARRAEQVRKHAPAQMIDLEGQAKGLVARLGEKRS